MKKLFAVVLLMLLPAMTFAQNNTPADTVKTSRFRFVFAGSNVVTYYPAAFFNERPRAFFGQELGVGLRLFGFEGMEALAALGFYHYSFQSDRRHKNVIHRVRFGAYSASLPVYLRWHPFSHVPIYLRAGVRVTLLSHKFYIYDIYQNGDLIYHQKVTGEPKEYNGRYDTPSYNWFPSKTELTAGAEWYFSPGMAVYLSVYDMKYPNVGFGIVYKL